MIQTREELKRKLDKTNYFRTYDYGWKIKKTWNNRLICLWNGQRISIYNINEFSGEYYCHRKEQEENMDQENKEFNSEKEGKELCLRYKSAAIFLFNLLDDIDSAADMFRPKGDDFGNVNFYNYVMETVKKRFYYFQCNGYRIKLIEE
jgi:hypothetical protein